MQPGLRFLTASASLASRCSTGVSGVTRTEDVGKSFTVFPDPTQNRRPPSQELPEESRLPRVAPGGPGKQLDFGHRQEGIQVAPVLVEAVGAGLLRLGKPSQPGIPGGVLQKGAALKPHKGPVPFLRSAPGLNPFPASAGTAPAGESSCCQS